MNAAYVIRDVSLALEALEGGGCTAGGTLHDVHIAGGRIVRIAVAGSPDAGAGDAAAPDRSDDVDEPGKATVIGGQGLVALPGFTDLYGRLREPGPSGRGSLASETRAALAGGFTRVLCAPDTRPVIDDTATVELIRRRTSDSPGAAVLPMAALTRGLDGRELAPLATLQGLGCVAAGQADRPLEDTGVLLSAMQYAASFDLPLVMTPRDAHLGADGCAHDGAVASRLGLPGVPVAAETVALARLLELARESGCRLHVSRLSSARGVVLVAEAKASGLPVTADVGIHHLLFTEAEIDGFDARYRAEVPFRSATDRQALRDAVRAGVIDAICSDHAPLDGDARLAPFPSCEPGLCAYDRFASLLLALPSLLGMPPSDVLERVIDAPARVLGLPAREGAGTVLAEGMAADLVLLDASADADGPVFGAGRNTPLEGVFDLAELTGEAAPLRGVVRLAMVGGDLRLDARR